MFRSGGIFFLVLSVLLTAAVRHKFLDAMFATIGWIVVVVYTANVITRWILSAIPKTVAKPEGKAVLITGCDTGFGLELCKRLIGKGFNVYACCLSLESEGAIELQQLKESTDLIKIHQLDVTNYKQIQEVYKEVEADLGNKILWAVVNNAGVAIFSELEWCSMSVIEHMFNVNVLGAVRVTKAFLPLLRASDVKGRVIVVSSVAGHITYPGFVSYSMTKHALISLADGLRREMIKWDVKVALIEPSMYKTRISESDVLTGALDNSWEKTPDAIKEAYGFPYYEDFKGRMQKLALKARPYLGEVVDSMEQAVTELNPKIVYRCSGPSDKVRVWIMSILPIRLLDLVICHIIQPNHRQLSRGTSRSTKSSTSSEAS